METHKIEWHFENMETHKIEWHFENMHWIALIFGTSLFMPFFF